MLRCLIVWGTNASLQRPFPHGITCKPAGVKWQAWSPKLLPSLVRRGVTGPLPYPTPGPPLWVSPSLPQNTMGRGGPLPPALAPLQNLSYLRGWEMGLFSHHPHPRPLCHSCLPSLGPTGHQGKLGIQGPAEWCRLRSPGRGAPGWAQDPVGCNQQSWPQSLSPSLRPIPNRSAAWKCSQTWLRHSAWWAAGTGQRAGPVLSRPGLQADRWPQNCPRAGHDTAVPPVSPGPWESGLLYMKWEQRCLSICMS